MARHAELSHPSVIERVRAHWNHPDIQMSDAFLKRFGHEMLPKGSCAAAPGPVASDPVVTSAAGIHPARTTEQVEGLPIFHATAGVSL